MEVYLPHTDRVAALESLRLRYAGGHISLGANSKHDQVAAESIATWCYFLARIYLLVEVFIGMRAMEPGIFPTLNWTEYIPHVG